MSGIPRLFRRSNPPAEPKPLVFVYQRLPDWAEPEALLEVMEVRDDLVKWATALGWCVAGVWTEVSERSSVELQAMCDSAQRRGVAAVCVSDVTALGVEARTRRASHDRLGDAGLGLLVMADDA